MSTILFWMAAAGTPDQQDAARQGMNALLPVHIEEVRDLQRLVQKINSGNSAAPKARP